MSKLKNIKLQRAENTRRNVILSEAEMRNPKNKILYRIIYLIILCFVVISSFPVMWTILSATKDIDEFYRIPPTIIPKTFHPEKFLEAWKMFSFGKYYLNTLVVATGQTLITVISNGLMAYSLSRLKPVGHKAIFMLIFWTMMLPGSLAAQMKIIIDFPIFHVNLVNTIWPMWIMAGGNCFTIIWFKNYFDNVPTAIIDAAKIDGATNLKIFYKIVLPMAQPVILTQALTGFIGAWQDYFWPMLLLKDKNIQTIMVRVLALQGSLSMDKRMIMLVLVMVPPMIFFMVFQKYLMGDANAGGVKG